MNIKPFLSDQGDQSMMRLMANRAVWTACFIAVFAVCGAVCGFVLAIILKFTNIELVGSIIGAILGGTAAISGTFLVSAFGGKSIQSFAENQPDKKPEV